MPQNNPSDEIAKQVAITTFQPDITFKTCCTLLLCIPLLCQAN